MSKKKPAYIDGKFVGDTLSISIKPYYQKEYEFLKNHHNRSGLICELVKQYIEGGSMPVGYQPPQYQAPVATSETVEEKVGEQVKEENNKSKETKEEIVEKKEEAKKETKSAESQVPVMALPSFMSQ